jgi:hypothetical protein
VVLYLNVELLYATLVGKYNSDFGEGVENGEWLQIVSISENS